jgi:hypothetical protein
MKKLACLACAGAALTLCQSVQANVLVTLLPRDQPIAVGGVADVYLRISGLGATASPPSLGAFDIYVGYDPGILGFVGFTFGDRVLGDQLDLSGGGTITIVEDIPGSLNFVHLFELSLDPPDTLIDRQASAFMLGRLRFSALAPGWSFLLLFADLADENGDRLPADTEGAVVSTPEPGTLWMLVVPSGALAFTSLGRRLRIGKQSP